MNARPPKLLFFVENPTSFQHLTRSRLLPLISGDEGFECTVVLPPSLDPSPAERERLPGVKFHLLDIHQLRPRDWLGRTLKKGVHVVSRDLLTVHAPHATLSQDRRHQLKQRGKNLDVRLGYAHLLKWAGLSWRHISRVAQNFGRYTEIAAILDEVRPDYVVYFNILIGQMDFLREVKRRGIPLILDMPNWDQASSKGPMTVLPDHVFVWSEFIKRDFCEIHDFPTDRVHPIGVLQFDCYFQGNPPLSREEFCQLHQIDPAAKIVLYAYGQPPGIKACEPFVNEILGIIGDNRLGFPCHLLFRASPRVPFPATLRERQSISIQHPLGHEAPDGLGWIPSPEEDRMRMSTLMHSDVIINVFSTMCLDSLCLHKPVINLGYVCGADESQPNLMERFFTYTHVIPVIRSSGTWIPRSRRELEQSLTEALSSPGTRRSAADELLHEICGPSDGESYQRWLAAFEKVRAVESGKTGARS
ncbi:hypothetical protein [Prosthecobacter sp.]|uniref:hypothetical protein n=1 Tax=Prosthecobacter sp. TaxID=1965333 RepID=UPI002AB9A781|nr:hypothetical protein [Prosthecobacter sp.]MDZ4405802.1 hypothetical protein [Prosthecobacter sp.]